MSTAEQPDQLRLEFIKELSDEDEAVTIDHLLKETSAKDREEAKQILRKMIDEGMISTTPGFKYRLASGVSATA